jgi:dephospho-CoA kinase
VRLAQHRFMGRARAAAAALMVNDVPLLFETGGERRCDYVAVVSAPPFVQRQRVLARPGMSADKLAAILAQQTPDREKRRRADFVIPSGSGKRVSLGHIRAIVAALSRAPRTAPRRRVGRRVPARA